MAEGGSSPEKSGLSLRQRIALGVSAAAAILAPGAIASQQVNKDPSEAPATATANPKREALMKANQTMDAEKTATPAGNRDNEIRESLYTPPQPLEDINDKVLNRTPLPVPEPVRKPR